MPTILDIKNRINEQKVYYLKCDKLLVKIKQSHQRSDIIDLILQVIFFNLNFKYFNLKDESDQIYGSIDKEIVRNQKNIVKNEICIKLDQMNLYVAPTYINLEKPTFWKSNN